VLLALTTSCMPGNPLGHHLKLSAEFSDSAGLFVGNDVGVLGVRVGHVTGIHPSGASVRVDMVITDPDVKIPADAEAVIVSRSVATDRYVELTPTYSGGAELAAGSIIPLDRTRTPVDFDQVLTSLNNFSVGVSGSKDTAQAVRRFLRVGAQTFGPNGPAMHHAILTLGAAVDGVDGQRQNVVQTMSALNHLASKLVTNRRLVQRFVDSVAGTTRLLAKERGDFRRALVRLSHTVDVVAKFAKDNRDRLKSTLGDVADVSDILLSRKAQVAEFIEEMPLLSQNIQRTRTQGGVNIRAAIANSLGGPLLAEICRQVPASLCDMVGPDPTGPLVDLLDKLLGGGGG
jgi:phospholipid/cholesterol/gamma-HCH transport system substrate-binding protein